ncbi:hypothetical protein Alide2_4325 [Alicycliphilus denitrificans K601]|uniref:Uncharacterized protein n=1 Tax=Alicycliphilus denitrificans (strain DSM 14773 / CIP 107495 / K601) TaxID=596154 RepID=F4G7P0_ALIDK|nr:hypothetical protein Alide2_4325 [Alicycliphilus denitrificans K601]
MPDTLAAPPVPPANAGQQRVPQLGDARSGKLAGNLAAFGRALRRAGVPVDAARMALAQQAVQLVGVARKDDMATALEAVLVSRAQDRLVFRELFDAFFRAQRQRIPAGGTPGTLNPLLRFDGYQPSARGAAVLHQAADAMLAVHNITQLQQLADAIARLMKQ